MGKQGEYLNRYFNHLRKKAKGENQKSDWRTGAKESPMATIILAGDLGNTAIGRIEDDGVIYDSDWGGNAIGRVENDGTVYDSDWGGNEIGRVDDEGIIYDSPWGGNAIGRVERDGSIYDSDWGGNVVARAEGNRKRLAGAAYLLVLGADW